MTSPPSPYRPGSAYETCPAAEGADPHPGSCVIYPDGAHRCAEPRDGHLTHGCMCAYAWRTVLVLESAAQR